MTKYINIYIYIYIYIYIWIYKWWLNSHFCLDYLFQFKQPTKMTYWKNKIKNKVYKVYIILIKEHLNRLTEKDSQLCSFLCLVISQDLNIKKELNIWSACMDERCKDNVLKTDALKAKWTGSYFILCAVCHVMPERSADTSVRGSHDLSGFDLMEICYLSVVNPWSHVHYHSNILGC